MSTSLDTTLAEQVLAIAEDLFTAMIDGEPGTVTLAVTPVPLREPLHAWVDVAGATPARAVISTERPTGHALARALLGMAPHEPVVEEDLVDAFGEMANVVGGNMKSLLPDTGALTLPQVGASPPPVSGTMAHEIALDWRGHGIVISIWALQGKEGTE